LFSKKVTWNTAVGEIDLDTIGYHGFLSKKNSDQIHIPLFHLRIMCSWLTQHLPQKEKNPFSQQLLDFVNLSSSFSWSYFESMPIIVVLRYNLLCQRKKKRTNLANLFGLRSMMDSNSDDSDTDKILIRKKTFMNVTQEEKQWIPKKKNSKDGKKALTPAQRFKPSNGDSKPGLYICAKGTPFIDSRIILPTKNSKILILIQSRFTENDNYLKKKKRVCEIKKRNYWNLSRT